MKLQKIKTATFTIPKELDADGAKIEVKHLLNGDISDIRQEVVKDGFEVRTIDGKPEFVHVSETNSVKDQQLTVVASVVGWEGFRDENGEVMECTKENKLKLCRMIEGDTFLTFMAFLKKCRDELAGKAEEQKEEAEKN